jgi:hypothetical protein
VTYLHYDEYCDSDDDNWRECEILKEVKKKPKEWYRLRMGDEPV